MVVVIASSAIVIVVIAWHSVVCVCVPGEEKGVLSQFMHRMIYIGVRACVYVWCIQLQAENWLAFFCFDCLIL